MILRCYYKTSCFYKRKPVLSWNQTLDQHFDANLKKRFFVKFCCKFLTFSLFCFLAQMLVEICNIHVTVNLHQLLRFSFILPLFFQTVIDVFFGWFLHQTFLGVPNHCSETTSAKSFFSFLYLSSFIPCNVPNLGDVIDPTQIIKKPSLSVKFLPSEISRIMGPSNQWKNKFSFLIVGTFQ